MSFPSWPEKDPDDVLDYSINWAPRLELDTIETSIWIVPDDLEEDSSQISADNRTTTIWLSGGIAGTTYQVTNRVTTNGGRTMDQTVKLKVKQK